jgi:hypothetical protein
MSEKDTLDELIQNTPKWTTEHFDHLKKIKEALDAERKEHTQEKKQLLDLNSRIQDELDAVKFSILERLVINFCQGA